MVERRSTMSIDPERFGELSATVKSLEKSMTQGFERLERSFEEFKEAHDLQARKDYEYLDEKIDKVKASVRPLLEEYTLRQKGFLPWAQKKFGEILLSGVFIFIIGWIGWSLFEYIKVIK